MWNDKELSKMVEGGIPFHMASDTGGDIGTLYGVYDEEARVEMRGRFIIDPDGIIDFYNNGNFKVEVVEIVKGITSVWGQMINGR